MSTDSSDIVYFLQPDGSKVSNDPRFDITEAREEMLAATENTGDVGIPRNLLEAQTQSQQLANLQSGQPGVGDNAAPSDPNELLPTTGSGTQVQRDDVKAAQEAGATPPTAEVPDSNQAVADAQAAQKESDDALAKAAAKLGEDGAGDPSKPYSDWTGNQLRYEVARRNADRTDADRIDMTGVTKKSQVVELLQADDEANPASAGTGATPPVA